MILDDIKTILGIEFDISKDDLLNIYIKKATTSIINYLNVDITTDVQTLYPDAIVEFVVITMGRRGNESLKQFSLGSKSGTFNDDLPNSVKTLLPYPSLRMR